MDETVWKLFSAGLAVSTKKSYKSCSEKYARFCRTRRVTPYPTSESRVCNFVAHLFEEGLAGGSLKVYLAAIRFTQIALGLGAPSMSDWPKLGYVVRGFKKMASVPSGRTRLPITPTILRKLKVVWEGKEDGRMLWAMACMCFFGFLRSGEAVVPSEGSYDPEVHLSVGDVRVDDRRNPSYIEVHVKASKTDIFRKGAFIYLGKTECDLCPVSAILAYMCGAGLHKRKVPCPFFQHSNGTPLTRVRLVRELRAALAAAGVDAREYAGHSFRIGAASTAAMCGMPESLIKTLGRWESAAYMLYIRTPRTVLCSVARQLAKPSGGVDR